MSSDYETGAGRAGAKPPEDQSVLGRVRAHLFNMFAFDLRSLALFRVSLALLMLADLFNRIPDVEAHYTDFGVLPRTEYITNFAQKYMLSFHMWGGTEFAIYLLMTVQAIFCIGMLIGWRTRLMHFLSWVFLISLQGRNPYVLQAGDVLLRQIMLWSMFLPLGAHWSVDAAMNTTATENPPPRRIAGMVAFGLLMQICLVYWYTVALKTGVEWKDGTAVWFALNLDHFSTPVARFLIQYPWLTAFLTYFTYWFEMFGPFLAFMPIFPQFFRIIAVVGMLGMHIGFGAGLKIGLFVFVSCVAWLPMIPTIVWDRLEAWLDRRRPQEATIAYDADCGFCRRAVRGLAGLLLLRKTRLVPAQSDPALEAAMRGADSWVYIDHQGQTHVRGDAGIAALRNSPLFWWLAPVLGLGPFRSVIELLYGAVRKRRGTLGRNSLILRERPYKWQHHWLISPIAFLLLIFVVLWNNGALEPKQKFMGMEFTIPTADGLEKYVNDTFFNGKKTFEVKALAYTLRVDQKWNMFAPRPMTGDGWYVVVGTSRKNKVVNLWNETNSPDWVKPEDPSSIYPGQRWRKYMMNLWMKEFKKHRRHYGRYVCRDFDRDNPGDKLDTFHMYYMKEETLRDGVGPIECVTMWRHWCTDNGKNVKLLPYADTCEEINVRAAAEKASRAACKCTPEDTKCWEKASKKHDEFVKKRDKTEVKDAGILAEIAVATAEWERCAAAAPVVSATVTK